MNLVETEHATACRDPEHSPMPRTVPSGKSKKKGQRPIENCRSSKYVAFSETAPSGEDGVIVRAAEKSGLQGNLCHQRSALSKPRLGVKKPLVNLQRPKHEKAPCHITES